MKAITYRKYGSPDVFQIENIEKPPLADNEIMIKIHAVEVTKADCELRSFCFPVSWFWLPLRIVMGIRTPRNPVLGGYFSGEISSIGSKINKFRVGDQVYGSTGFRFGAYGEYVNLPETATLAIKPNNMSHAEAACIPLGGLNALHFLQIAKVKSGEKVLVNGAGGSIGLFGVQIAKAFGAEVTAVDKEEKKQMLLEIGADHFIDYQKQSFADNKHKYDVIFDMVAGSAYQQCIDSLTSKGQYIMGNPQFPKMIRSIWTNKVSSKQVRFAFANETIDELKQLSQLIKNEKIRPIVDKIFPFEKVVQAHNMVETEQRIGSIILSPFCPLS